MSLTFYDVLFFIFYLIDDLDSALFTFRILFFRGLRMGCCLLSRLRVPLSVVSISVILWMMGYSEYGEL